MTFEEERRMLVTEGEAKTKRCQESFSGRYVSPEGNSSMAISMGSYMTVMYSSPSYCIGSKCMAWRVGREAIAPVYERIDLPAEDIPDVAKGWERDGEIFAHQPWSHGDGTPTYQKWRRVIEQGKPALGFCGKAGSI